MSDLMKVEHVDLANVDPSIVAAVMDELTERRPGVRFKQTNWIFTQDKSEKDVPAGATVSVNISGGTISWLKFGKDKILAKRTVGMFSGEQLPDRSELGDLDEDEWEVNDQGKPQDPWAKSWEFPSALMRKNGAATECTLTGTGYNYGLSVGALLKAVFATRAANAGKVPLVKLEQRVKKDRYGNKNVPVLTLAKWIKPPETEAPVEPEDGVIEGEATEEDDTDF